MQTAKRNCHAFEVLLHLTKRHLLVFFKNKVRLFYTLLVPVIIFLVYVFFLRSLELSTVENMMYQLGIAADGTLSGYINALVDSWMLSGIAALSTITVALQTNTMFVEDKQNGVNRDFISSPIPRGALICSYFLYNFLVTLFICAVYLVICFAYLAGMGEFYLTFVDIAAVFGILAYTTVSSTLFTIFLCSYIKTEGTMASLVAIFSTAVGFLIGAYMPLGMLPEWVQNICAFIPGTYACSLMRYSLMAAPMQALTEYAAGIGISAEFISELSSSFGYQLNFFGVVVEPSYQALATAVFIVLFFLLNLLSGKNLAAVFGGRKKRKLKSTEGGGEQ